MAEHYGTPGGWYEGDFDLDGHVEFADLVILSDNFGARANPDQVTAVPGLALDKAVQWVDNGWTELTRFVGDARIPLDNGLAERVIRGVVIGRKVYAGSRSEKGTQVAALFYSLVESCRLAGVDPRAYLREAVRGALKDRDSALLPEDYAASLNVEDTNR